MKALIYTLLFIIGTHVLVLDAVHHEHDEGVAYEQVQQDGAHQDVLDQGSDHCCQCHGFMTGVDCAPARLPAPASPMLALRPELPEAPPGTPFRPPIS